MDSNICAESFSSDHQNYKKKLVLFATQLKNFNLVLETLPFIYC